MKKKSDPAGAIGGVIVVVFLAGWLIWGLIPNSGKSEGTVAASTPTPDPAALRLVMKAYWQRTHADYHRALSAVAEAMSGGNRDAAEQAKRLAQEGANDAARDVPPGWEDVSTHMSNTLAGLLDLAGKIEAGDDRQTIEAASDYQRTEFVQAEHLGMEAYLAAMGDRRDLTP